MKKLILPLLVLIIVLAACGNNGGSGKSDSKEETKSYKLDSGKTIKIPKDPKRIAVVAPTFAGGLHKLGANIVAVNNQVDQSPILKEKFDKNIKKYQKIAPTIVVDYGKHKYLEQQEMLGKIMGKEDEVKKWEDKWKKQTEKDGKEIKDAIGKDSTVSILDEFDKKVYTYGDNWGRGGEVLYQAFGLNMPKGQQDLVKKEGWAEVSQEKIEDVAGDYIVSTGEGKSKPSYETTNIWKNLPAVKNNNVIEVKAETYWYNDPYTLDFMRKDLKDKLLKASK